MTIKLGGDRTRPVLVDGLTVQGTSGGMNQQQGILCPCVTLAQGSSAQEGEGLIVWWEWCAWHCQDLSDGLQHGRGTIKVCHQRKRTWALDSHSLSTPQILKFYTCLCSILHSPPFHLLNLALASIPLEFSTQVLMHSCISSFTQQEYHALG